jgi:predicted phage baseplate assembly protein
MRQACDCCGGREPLTPAPTANRPGLDALAYRIGTHGSFLTTMLARLSSPEHPALGALSVRTADDPGIALLDAWAVVGDVLTFYQERIANEGYLRTATERRSLLELARLVGHTLRPGVAASVYLAYTLDPTPGGDAPVTIPAGSRAQSVPGPGELPQAFETSDDLEARPSWNTLQVARTRPARITGDIDGVPATIDVEGVATGLRPNDALLLIFTTEVGGQLLRKVRAVTPDPAAGRTTVALQQHEAPSFAALLDAVAANLAAHRDFGLHPDVAHSPTAVRIATSTLEPLQTSLAAPEHRTPSGLLALVEPVLPALQEQLAFARARRLDALADWLGAEAAALADAGVVPALQRAAAAARERGGTPPPPRPSPLALRLARNGDAPTTAASLDDLVGPLRRPPSQPPRSTQELARSLDTLLAPGSDLGPQVLVALAPELSGTLYPAWAAADVTAPGPLRSVQALRVRAAPFGAAAPPQPIVDERGVVVGTREWPLDRAVVTTVRVQYNSDYTPVRLRLQVDVAGSSSSAELDVASVSDVALPPRKADVDVDEPTGPTATFRHRTTVSFGDGGTGPVVTVEQPADFLQRIVRVDQFPGSEWRLLRGQAVQAQQDGRRITIDLRPSTFEGDPGDALTITVVAAPEPRNVLPLDALYEQIVPQSWVVVERAGEEEPLITRVLRVEPVGMSAYGLSGTVTQLTLADPWLREDDALLSAIRGVAVHAQSEVIELAREPRDDDVEGRTIELDRLYDGLQTGRWLVVSGERADVPATTGASASELVMLAGVAQLADPDLPGDKVHTVLELSTPLAYRYRRASVTIAGNVVKATHGETRKEVLGSGNGSQALQTFALRQAPLTHVAAANPSGAESTLEVYVDEVRWHEAASLADLGPGDRGYLSRTGDDDKTSVTFGNGEHGARLPTEIENVKAFYRTGIGRAGNVNAGQVSQLQTKPLGVSGVSNPLPASGGADREGLDQARRSTPLGVLALDRLVSAQDYEDFARTRAGIGKASVRRVTDGQRELIHLTIAGSDNIPIDRTSDLYQNLRLALAQNGDPHQPVEVAVRELALLVISARIRVEPDRLWELVEPKVRAALLDAFAFERRELGQDALLSEVVSTIQAVPGVDYVDVEAFAKVAEGTTPSRLEQLGQTLPPRPPARLPAELARFEVVTHDVEQHPADGAPGPVETLTEIAAVHGLTLDELLRLNPGLAEPRLTVGQQLVVARGLRPAQLLLLTSAVPDTLVLQEIKG